MPQSNYGADTTFGRVVDGALEATIVGSFTRVGYVVRRRTAAWTDPPSMRGRVAIVTGASSGIGRAAVVGLARLGARVYLVGRDKNRTYEAAEAVQSAGGDAEPVVLDVSDARALTAFAERFSASNSRLDALVHNAGALLADYCTTTDGIEMTVATHVLAPFRLTWLLAPMLQASGDAVVVIVASGGMYAETLDLERLEMHREDYDGVRAYARAKRAQVVLSHAWADRLGRYGVASYAMHPGWVNTPGLATGLPSFKRLGPLLRKAEEGADTVVWLAANGPRHQTRPGYREAPTSGFWLDRRLRGEYYRPGTRPTDPFAERKILWEWCSSRTGLQSGFP